MSQWAFVAAAYVVTLGGAGALTLVSYLQMRRAERHTLGDAERP